ncbi:MAG: hypothetical protein WBM44_21365 [Waterburya sp.]
MNKDIDSDDTSLPTEHSNSRLIYEYTESHLRYYNQGLDNIRQKATTLLGFTGIILKFSAELPSTDIWLILTKVGACTLLAANIVICIVVLNPGKAGEVVEPSELINDWFYEEEHHIRLFIARQWLKTCEQLDEVYDWKAKQLQNCYSCIGLAVILFAINVILNTICPVVK